MKVHNIKNSLFLGILISSMACSQSTSEPEAALQEEEQLLQISEAQFENNKMEIGEPSNQFFEEQVSSMGSIMAEPKGMAQISSQIPGIVKSIHCTLGDYLKKGQLITMISSNDLIIKQQEFVETAIKLNQVKSDYERIKTLFEDKISAKKEFLSIESEYKSLRVKYKSLELQLNNLGLDTDKIKKGELYSSYPITASISGYITQQNLVIGKYIEPQDKLAEIVNTDKMHLHLSIFESDLSKLKKGQKVEFKLLGEGNASHFATLSSIGKTIDTESKAIECLANITVEKDFDFVNQSFAEANIIVESIEGQALPNEALIKSGDDFYVLVVERMEEGNYFLKKHKVSIGNANSQYTEVVNAEDLKNVIVSGVYNLNVE